MDSAFEWKQYYAAERSALGRDGMLALLDEAPAAVLADGGALVVPHTRLQVTGSQTAAAVNGVIACGADRVLAIGVLHGGTRGDAATVGAARAGDAAATGLLRRVHFESDHAGEEFSLDAFTEMLAVAARRARRSIEVIRRYPFLVGDDPGTLPGLDELRAFVDEGCALVVTADPLHHGIGYGDHRSVARDEHDPQTLRWASEAIAAQAAALSAHRFAEFQQLAAAYRSDFRDSGAVLALLLGRGFTWSIDELALVDYSTTLNAPAPTWVAGALVTAERA